MSLNKVLTKVRQALTNEQKQIACSNIGAIRALPEFHTKNDGSFAGNYAVKTWYYGPTGESYTMVGLVSDYQITLTQNSKLRLSLDASSYINNTIDVYCALAVDDTDKYTFDGWNYFKVISKPMAKRKLYGMDNGLATVIADENNIDFEIASDITIKKGQKLFVLFGVRGEDNTAGQAQDLFVDTFYAEDCGRYYISCFIHSLYYMQYWQPSGSKLITPDVGFEAGLKFGFKISGGSPTAEPKEGYINIQSTYANTYFTVTKSTYEDSDLLEDQCTVKLIPQHLRLVSVD